MDLSVKEFTEKEARALCRWRYPRPYDGYNCPDWETVQAEHWGMADVTRRRQEFYAVYGGEAYVGFFRLIKREDCVMLGLGLRPDLCGKGRGPT